MSEDKPNADVPETLMGFPVKYREKPMAGEPLGEIVLGDWSCWAQVPVILTNDSGGRLTKGESVVQHEEKFDRTFYIAAGCPASYKAEELAQLICETWAYLQDQGLVGEGKPEMPARLLGLPVKWKPSPSGPWPRGNVVLDESGCWVDEGETWSRLRAM